MLVLSLTGKCNFACKYCYADRHPQDTMSMETAVGAIELAAQADRAFILQFSGGEPLLAAGLLQDIVRHVRRRKLPAVMQLQTNASLLTQDIVRYLREAGVGIGISLDGRPDINDLSRCYTDGAGASQDILLGAKCLIASGVDVGVTCVVSKANVGHLAGIVEMAYFLGNVRRIGFDLLRAQGRGALLEPPSASEVEQGVEAALMMTERLSRSTGRTIKISQLERVETLAGGKIGGFGHCHALNGEAAFVDARGYIYPCSSLVGDDVFLLGQVEAGIDPAKQKQVTCLIQDSMAFCLRCPDFSLCGGGCFARWYGSGVGNGAYPAECALKKAAIRWHRQVN
ncbi:anaerobic sulfatase-maturating enzyme [Methylomusa anaerophila]|uniref:Anaerobic sulfatase-maturating enzyme n=2 Tax=Methylomusa anaerophila TaxID=1930071 RepID=A0A348ALE0_9FIRM|nr:anaerobic sulfatase-maturating enzyme [Methylomusa anaerophila]